MAHAPRGFGGIATGTTTVSPTYPSGVIATDRCILTVTCKPETVIAAALGGWTLLGSASVGTGTAGTGGTGPQRLAIYERDATASLTGTVAVATTGCNVAAAQISAYAKAASDTWATTTVLSGLDTTTAPRATRRLQAPTLLRRWATSLSSTPPSASAPPASRPGQSPRPVRRTAPSPSASTPAPRPAMMSDCRSPPSTSPGAPPRRPRPTPDAERRQLRRHRVRAPAGHARAGGRWRGHAGRPGRPHCSRYGGHATAGARAATLNAASTLATAGTLAKLGAVALQAAAQLVVAAQSIAPTRRRPVADVQTAGWTPTGAATIWQALSDQSTSTYATTGA